jgi:hypothetical protein
VVLTDRVEEVWGAKHSFIPPGCCNANTDVESSRGLIEQEFYDLEPFCSREDFLSKAALYQDYFNFVRSNLIVTSSYKGARTPWEIINEERPWISPEVLKLPPVFLDEEFKKSYLPYCNHRMGQHLPVDPGNSKNFTIQKILLDIILPA